MPKHTIVVSGLVALYPVGGVAWDYLQYVVGLSRLGHDVYYHEDTWMWPYHPVERRHTSTAAYSAAFIDRYFSRYAPRLRDSWHYRHLREESCGMTESAFEAVARRADLFLNVSGAGTIPENLAPHCVKVFLDTDPGYNQIVLSERPPWSENVDRWCRSVADHDRHFTYAENIGGEDCTIPRAGFAWEPTRMPVVLDLWEPLRREGAAGAGPWTTVMTWNAFKGRLVYRGREYGGKDREFERFIEVPHLLDVPFEIAVGGRTAPLQRLRDRGWVVRDGPEATATPERYADFIGRSRGEFSVAKQVYVAMRTGWFSCRSACYLAAGRPVVVQDTGFSKVLPTGDGVVAFSTREEAVNGIREVEADYARHAEAARAMAHDYFGAERVLADLIERALGPGH